MNLREIVGSPEKISGESEGNVNNATTVTLEGYSPNAGQYSLFCEQFFEKPALLKGENSSIAARATDSLTYGDTHVSRDD